MKTVALLCFLAIKFCVQVGAYASQPKRITTSVDCGSFQLYSITDQMKVPDEFTRATFQVIRLVNRSHHTDMHLDLKQHLSRDRKLGGMLDIDGAATEWWCIHAKSGADFVFIGFFCTKEDAKSCSTAMGSPSAGWRQIYDSEGNALFRKPPDAPDSEERLMKKLDVYDAFHAPIDSGSSKPIFAAY